MEFPSFPDVVMGFTWVSHDFGSLRESGGLSGPTVKGFSKVGEPSQLSNLLFGIVTRKRHYLLYNHTCFMIT